MMIAISNNSASNDLRKPTPFFSIKSPLSKMRLAILQVLYQISPIINIKELKTPTNRKNRDFRINGLIQFLNDWISVISGIIKLSPCYLLTIVFWVDIPSPWYNKPINLINPLQRVISSNQKKVPSSRRHSTLHDSDQLIHILIALFLFVPPPVRKIPDFWSSLDILFLILFQKPLFVLKGKHLYFINKKIKSTFCHILSKFPLFSCFSLMSLFVIGIEVPSQASQSSLFISSFHIISGFF